MKANKCFDLCREGFILKKVKNDGIFHVGGGSWPFHHGITFFCMGSESSRNAIKKIFTLGGGVRDSLPSSEAQKSDWPQKCEERQASKGQNMILFLK